MRVLNRIRTLTAGCALALAVMPGVALAESLADALVASYRNSNLLEQNRALLRAADEDVQQSISALYPVVSFATTALTNNTGTDYQLQLGLQASVTVLDFGRGRLGVDFQRESVLSTRAALIVIEQNVLLNAVSAYMNLYSDLQTLQLQRNNVGVINEQLRAARERFELGDSTRTDVALAEARLAASRSALAAAEGDVAISREQYNLAVGQYPASIDAPPRLPQLPPSLEAAQETARRNHPAITQVQHQVTAADILTRQIGLERLGTVEAGASVSTVTPRPQLSNRDVSASANLSYSVPLYTAGRLRSAERQGVARAQAQRSNLHQTVAIVQESVASSWARLQIARASLAAGDLQISAAQSAFDAVSAEAELGSRTTLDVLDAEQELLNARSARIVSAANVQLAAYSLLEAMGQLTVQALNLGIPTYDVEAYAAGFRRGPAPVVPSRQGDALDRIMDRYQVRER